MDHLLRPGIEYRFYHPRQGFCNPLDIFLHTSVIGGHDPSRFKFQLPGLKTSARLADTPSALCPVERCRNGHDGQLGSSNAGHRLTKPERGLSDRLCKHPNTFDTIFGMAYLVRPHLPSSHFNSLNKSPVRTAYLINSDTPPTHSPSPPRHITTLPITTHRSSDHRRIAIRALYLPGQGQTSTTPKGTGVLSRCVKFFQY